jgi:glutathione S-transferase
MRPSPVRLYDFPFSGNGYKVRLALAHLGLGFDYRIVDLIAGETRSPDFLTRNPMGQIPVLELSDGTLLRESNAILFWLAEETDLMPADPLDRARVIQWMCFEQSNIDKVIGRAKFLRAYPDVRATTAAEFEGWWADGHAALAVMNGELAGRDFLVGQAFSAADICLYGYVHGAPQGGFDLARFPNVTAWLERVRTHPRHITIDDY